MANAKSAPRLLADAEARTPTGRPSRRHATVKSMETHEAIIAATLRCFHRVGYFRTNMSTVAKEAGVTRGCMQYYFPTTEALLETAAASLMRNIWEAHAESLHAAPAGPERLDHALNGSFRAGRDPNYQVLVELMAAARTEPALRPILLQAMQQFDRARLRLSAEMFGDEALGKEMSRRTASDLVAILAAGMAVYIFPDDASGRQAALLEALKEQVFSLWGVPRPQAKLAAQPAKRARRPA